MLTPKQKRRFMANEPTKPRGWFTPPAGMHDLRGWLDACREVDPSTPTYDEYQAKMQEHEAQHRAWYDALCKAAA